MLLYAMKENVLTSKEMQALRQIRNWIMHKGHTPSIRELMAALGYRSPRSAALIITNLIRKGFLQRKSNGGFQIVRVTADDESRAHTVDVPLVGIASCGLPLLAEENTEAMISVSTKMAHPPHKYFLLRANGDSMNKKGVNDGDMVLVRQQQTARNGDIVVALIDNEATIKEINISDNAIVLQPRSTNKEHRPIVLTKDFCIQGIVVKALPNI